MEKELDSYDTIKLIAESKNGKTFELKGFVYFTAWSASVFSYGDFSLCYQNIQILVPLRKKLTVMNWHTSCKIMSCRIVLTEKYIFNKENFRYPQSKISPNGLFVDADLQVKLATEEIGIKITF